MAEFPYFRHTSAGGGTLSGMFHTRKDAGTGSQRGWMPIQTTLGEGTLYTPTAMAGGDTLSFQAQENDAAGANVGSIVTLTGDGVAQSVRATMGATITAVGAGTNALSRHIQRSAAGAGATFPMFKGYSYEVLAPDDNITWLSAGDATFNWTTTNADRFYAFGWSGVTASTTLAGTRLPISCDGELQYLMIRYILAAPTNTVEFAIQVNGVDTAFLQSLPDAATGAAVVDNSTVVTVAQSDTVAIRYIRTAGATTTFQAHVMLGFRAT